MSRGSTTTDSTNTSLSKKPSNYLLQEEQNIFYEEDNPLSDEKLLQNQIDYSDDESEYSFEEKESRL